jgi:uncharacterized membrane protein YkoI
LFIKFDAVQGDKVMAEAPVVKLNADGEVVQCAKGMDSGECGYTPGAKVCGKCGAVAQQMKAASIMNPMMQGPAPAMPMRKKPRPMGPMTLEDEEDEDLVGMEGMEDDMEDDDMMDTEDGKMMGYDEEDDEMYVRRAAPKRKRGVVAMEDAEMDEEMEDEDEDVSMEATRLKMRNRRLGSMGYKSSEFDKDAFLCSFDRKVYPGGSPVCDSCPGGCVPEEGMPSLLEVEGMAEDMFNGKVLDSGYSDEADLFVVDIERKDGKPVEIFFDGSSGEVMGWHLLNSDLVEVKSALVNKAMISFGDAADIAVKTVSGDIVAVEPDVFEGYDVYAVEIDGVNGKSYDVFVSLDGEVLGYDEYTMEEATEIEAEAAEIALKRAYSEDTRQSMADKGQALPDGSYPIADEADLRNAIQAFGRAKDKTAAKAHIMKRAVALGKEELIPVSWVSKEDIEKAKGEEKSEDDNFLSTLMEFEMLTVAEDSDSEQ